MVISFQVSLADISGVVDTRWEHIDFKQKNECDHKFSKYAKVHRTSSKSLSSTTSSLASTQGIYCHDFDKENNDVPSNSSSSRSGSRKHVGGEVDVDSGLNSITASRSKNNSSLSFADNRTSKIDNHIPNNDTEPSKLEQICSKKSSVTISTRVDKCPTQNVNKIRHLTINDKSSSKIDTLIAKNDTELAHINSKTTSTGVDHNDSKTDKVYSNDESTGATTSTPNRKKLTVGVGVGEGVSTCTPSSKYRSGHSVLMERVYGKRESDQMLSLPLKTLLDTGYTGTYQALGLAIIYLTRCTQSTWERTKAIVGAL